MTQGLLPRPARVEIFGGPLDGDKMPEGYIPKTTLHIESHQSDDAGQALMHVYSIYNTRYLYRGLAPLEPGAVVAPLRIGYKLQ